MQSDFCGLVTSGIFPLIGREKIYTVYDEIDENNLEEILRQAMVIHNHNMIQEDYLYDYCRGLQPILARQKEIRPEINNKIVVNKASEIVEFKNGYFLTEPTFYKSVGSTDPEDVNKLNEYLRLSGKHEVDNEIVNNMHIMGIGVAYVQPTDGPAPCRVYSLDPRNAFVVYSRRPGNAPLMGVNIVKQRDSHGLTNVIHFDCFTAHHIYSVYGGYAGSLVADPNPVNQSTYVYHVAEDETAVNHVGKVNIIEYQYDAFRRGSFENVISLMDARNLVMSNRCDGVEQFIQSLMLLINCELPEDENGNKQSANDIRAKGLIELRNIAGLAQADVRILSEQLDQSQTQILLDDIDKQISEIAGVPLTSATSRSTSDNVGAVYLRNGFEQADTQARDCEDFFKKSDRVFREVFLQILQTRKLTTLNSVDVDVQFTRNEKDNMQSKVQTALGLKSFGMSPELCLAKSGVSNDPDGDVAKSGDYITRAFEGAGNGETAS